MNELFGIDKFVHDTVLNFPGISDLVGDRVFADQAPQGSSYPHVVAYPLPSGRYLKNLGRGRRVALNQTYLVKAVDNSKNTISKAQAIASLIDQALEGASGTAVDGSKTVRIVSVTCERPLRLPPENKGDQRFTHAGGIYRIVANEEP